MPREEKSALHLFAKGLHKVTNRMAILLFSLLLLFAGYSLWYSYSLQRASFLPEELARFKPDGQRPSISALQELNPDVVAWLTIDGTNIDYPVVQGENDYEYLNTTVLGEFSLAGSIFLSSSNSADFSDPYNMLYGHHVEGGAMFADVLKFRDASFFQKHQTGLLWYPETDGKVKADRIQLFAAVDAESSDSVIYVTPSAIRQENLTQVVTYILNKGPQGRAITVNENTRIIGLSTCEDASGSGRVLLFGILQPWDEETMQAQADK